MANQPVETKPIHGEAMAPQTAEHERLESHRGHALDWKRWGPYVSERAWGTVREDYSDHGTAWDYFPHEHARSRAYRWNEDGIAGICDRDQTLCFAIALWNGEDRMLKERLFGVTGPQGNHGEDVKECYFYLDSTPTHSYMKMLYKYPQAAFPYDQLVDENRRRSKKDPEFELIDTGIFNEHRYFDVSVEYAKDAPDDVLIRLTIENRGPDAADIDVLPTLWFRNTWSWDHSPKPAIHAIDSATMVAHQAAMGTRWLYCAPASSAVAPNLLFTENETNYERVFNAASPSPYTKDAFHAMLVDGEHHRVNPARTGTKAAAHYRLRVASGASVVLKLRIADREPLRLPQPFDHFDAIFATRIAEADAFYATTQSTHLNDDERRVQRQAFAGLLWSKQWYHYHVESWLDGDSAMPRPPGTRIKGRNAHWRHLHNQDILSMPDKWEYPWFAAWDLAFHCIPLAMVDPDFAKRQLILMLREWYMHPNGQIPAYEWAFGDVNPPVHAWAAWRVYKIDKKLHGKGDLTFLKRVFHKLLLNFTWWVNRKDADGLNVFQGGFLGLDNIGVFDRSAPLPTGGSIQQCDGTSWMAMYALNLMSIALELARHDHGYEDVATKFFEHFMYIAYSMNNLAGKGIELWDEEDKFPYDVLHLGDGRNLRMKIRSMVGLIPLFAVETLDPETLAELPRFKRRMEWFLKHRPALASLVSRWNIAGQGDRRLLALMRGHRMKRILSRMLDPNEFLSDFGIRSLSKIHQSQPYVLRIDGVEHRVDYEPGESTSGLFGGNSNWRGPIWFPVNFLLIESLQKFHHYYGDEFKVECPTGSGRFMTLQEVSDELSRRLTGIFLRDANGERPANGGQAMFDHDPHWRDLVPFHEYFHGETGSGLGASHQTGWTALVAKLLQSSRLH
ncbi:MAG: MGH1-like glycoside hydrolase domain-containing protein [Burkholderiales bacterium]